MKPHRIKMAHNLIINYGLDQKMDVMVRVDSSCSFWLSLIGRTGKLESGSLYQNLVPLSYQKQVRNLAI